MIPIVCVGYDPREADAFAVCVRSIVKHATRPVRVRPLLLPLLQACGAYTRPTHRFEGQLYDDISGAPMSTEFALSRFLCIEASRWAEVPRGDAVVFVDADFLFRRDIHELFALQDARYAVQVVKHIMADVDGGRKMDGQRQTAYPCKNWSSLMLVTPSHWANDALTLERINTEPGRWLHGFGWLDDAHIGVLPHEWNWLAGVDDADLCGPAGPAAVHYTLGVPSMPGYEAAPYADEWRAVRDACGLVRHGELAREAA